MKISEMTNEQAAEAMIRISTPIGNLCDDEKVMELINKYQSMSEKPFIQTIGVIIPEIVIFAFKTHKEDLYEIVGALTMQSADKVAKMNFVKTINVLKESYDDVLKDFFTSSKSLMTQNEEKSQQDS